MLYRATQDVVRVLYLLPTLWRNYLRLHDISPRKNHHFVDTTISWNFPTRFLRFTVRQLICSCVSHSDIITVTGTIGKSRHNQFRDTAGNLGPKCRSVGRIICRGPWIVLAKRISVCFNSRNCTNWLINNEKRSLVVDPHDFVRVQSCCDEMQPWKVPRWVMSG